METTFTSLHVFITNLGLILAISATGGWTNVAPIAASTSMGKLVLLPMENLTDGINPLETIMPSLTAQLQQQGFEIYPHSELRNLVRRHRMRSIGRISKSALATLQKESGANFIGLGTVNIFEEGQVAEISLSFRILDAKKAKVVWVKNVAVTSQDRVWMFNLGRTQNMNSLALYAVKKLFKKMPTCLGAECSNVIESSTRAAVIPFDNYSDEPHAGGILTNLVMAKLEAMHIDVIEPGFVEELLANRGSMYRGEIDLESMREIRKKYGIDYIITGAIDEYEPGQGDLKLFNPSVELSVKCLWTGGRSVTGMESRRANGLQQEIIFGLHRQYSISNLISNQIGKILKVLTMTQAVKPEAGKK